jgi:TRAP-type C4-dicarboxylate transport system substrate-binding protein
MKKFLSVTLSVVMVAAMLVGCGNKEEAPAAAAPAQEAAAPAAEAAAPAADAAAPASDYKLEMKLSHVFGPTEQLAVSIKEAADSIREKTNGAIDIQCYDSSQLPTYKDGLEQVASGANFISVEDPSYIGDYVPDFKALVGPMMCTSIEEYEYLINTDLVKGWIKKLEDDNIKVLALDYYSGFRFMKTNKEIRTPDDLKGMKIRVPKSDLFVNTLNAMGANAVPMGWDETLSAVSQGVVDGLEGSMTDFRYDGSGDVASVGSLTNHLIATCGVYFPLNVWNEIPAEYQTIIQDEFTASAQKMIKTIESSYEDDKKFLEENGHTFNDVDIDAFAARFPEVYEKIEGTTPGIYDTLKAELAKMPK